MHSPRPAELSRDVGDVIDGQQNGRGVGGIPHRVIGLGIKSIGPVGQSGGVAWIRIWRRGCCPDQHTVVAIKFHSRGEGICCRREGYRIAHS